MVNVTEQPDGSLTITWDPHDPLEASLSTWTEEDFLRAIREAAQARIEGVQPNEETL
jgi:hypothetical protein